jgi:hypothetical protein
MQMNAMAIEADVIPYSSHRFNSETKSKMDCQLLAELVDIFYPSDITSNRPTCRTRLFRDRLTCLAWLVPRSAAPTIPPARVGHLASLGVMVRPASQLRKQNHLGDPWTVPLLTMAWGAPKSSRKAAWRLALRPVLPTPSHLPVVDSTPHRAGPAPPARRR